MATARKGAKAVEKPKSATNGAGAGAGIVDTVRSLAAVVAEHSLSELIVDLPDATITLRRGPSGAITQVPIAMPMPMSAPMSPYAAHHAAPPPMGAPAPISAAPAEPSDDSHVVTSPFVGTFYRRPNPDSPTYVDLNEKVEKGQVLCIVEAMKLMNEIEADIAGTVVGVLAEDGAPVEYGQPLFKIAPA